MASINRRDSSAVGALHELASSKELKKALECPICNEVPLAPIYTCSNGHTTCGKCRIGLNCGVCRQDMSNTPRNATVEMIVANSSFYCKYLSDGCSQTIKGLEYRAHVLKCEYRRVKCYEFEGSRCKGAQIRLKEYFKHLSDVHQIGGHEMKNDFLTMSEYSNDLVSDGPWPSFYLQYDDLVFLRKMSIKNSVVYLWFVLLGPQEEADKYQMKISFYMKHNNKARCDWTIPVQSIRRSDEELELDGFFKVGIPSKTLEEFSNERKHPNGDIYQNCFDLRYEIMTV